MALEFAAEQGIPTAVLRAFYDWCVWQEEARKNEGQCGGAFTVGNKVYAFNPDIPTKQRNGIVYYSRGHGWRVRKTPHWRTIFEVRFPLHYAEFTKESES